MEQRIVNVTERRICRINGTKHVEVKISRLLFSTINFFAPTELAAKNLLLHKVQNVQVSDTTAVAQSCLSPYTKCLLLSVNASIFLILRKFTPKLSLLHLVNTRMNSIFVLSINSHKG
jgi:hypothetical protein